MKTYPEILGKNIALLPEAARSAEWFMSLPPDQRKYLWVCLTERSIGHTLGYIRTLVGTQPLLPRLTPIVFEQPPQPVKIATQRKQSARIKKSPITVPFVLEFDKYKLLLRDRQLQTSEKFNPDYCYVAIERVGHSPNFLCFGMTIGSISRKIRNRVQNGIRIEDVMIHELKLGAIS